MCMSNYSLSKSWSSIILCISCGPCIRWVRISSAFFKEKVAQHDITMQGYSSAVPSLRNWLLSKMVISLFSRYRRGLQNDKDQGAAIALLHTVTCLLPVAESSETANVTNENNRKWMVIDPEHEDTSFGHQNAAEFAHERSAPHEGWTGRKHGRRTGP